MTFSRGLVPFGPRSFAHRVFRDFDRLFDEGRFAFPFVRPVREFGEFAWAPDVEVFERDNTLVARVDLPGMKREEVSVTVTDEGLVIEGERRHEAEEEKNDWYRSERSYGRFSRVIALPEGVKASAIKATFEHGVLEVRVPLPIEAAAPAPARIEITTGGEKEEKKAVKAA
jgi:HSP20 family protein